MIAIFEDNSFEKFYPFTLNHATFEIRMGARILLDKIMEDNGCSVDDKIILIVRDGIKDVVAERYPNMIVNPEDLPSSCNAEIHIDEYLEGNFNNLFSFAGIVDTLLPTKFFTEGECDESCIMVNKKDIHISASARISAGVILDASEGAIIIDEDALIDIGALIKGPTYIGKNSIINLGAKLNGEVCIGPYCKIGGEVEHTTFHGYSNKQHDGYLGHSYIGEWVNLGANTNNSDLKNNYSSVRIKIGNVQVDTNEMFIGCIIGDYTKTGISTMINTGTYIGLGCNIFGAGFQDKYIQNFSWGKDEKTDLNKFIETLKVVKKRRNQKTTNAELELIKNIYSNKI